MIQVTSEKRIEAQGNWMVTFADLLSLLLTFFVLLFSMSTIEFENWKAVVATMSDEFNSQRPEVVLEAADTVNQLTPSEGAGLNLNYLRVLLQRSLETHAVFDGISVQRKGEQIIVSIPADLLFETKDTKLLAGALRPLRQLAGTFLQIKNKIHTAGYTNSAPVSNGKHRSNWELSMARARIVAGILTDSGYRRPITVLGYADTADVGLKTENAERVEIVIVAERSQKGIYDIF